MKRERAKELLPVISAFAEGKAIQFHGTYNWTDEVGENPDFGDYETTWRIKPLEFPPLPEGLSWSNGFNLNPEDVGDGFRLLTTKECNAEWIEGAWFMTHAPSRVWSPAFRDESCGAYASIHQPIRVPLSTPFPEPPKKPVMIPLEPEDIPPGSALRLKSKEAEVPYWMIYSVSSQFIYLTPETKIPWKAAQRENEVKRPGQDWKPCEKEAP